MSTWSIDLASTPPLWRVAAPGVDAAFTTRQGGVSETPYHALNLGRSTADDPAAVTANRARVLRALDLDPTQLATAGQSHGVDVSSVHSPGLHRDCDALVTCERGIALAVSAADCMPILYASRGGVAAAHSGWRGTADGMPGVALRALCDATGEPAAEVRVWLGPCIRECCYTVGPEVAARFPDEVIHRVGDELRLSMAGAAVRQLLASGMRRESIRDTGACTACEPAWYFSHRRDHGLTGRQWGVIARSV